MADGSIRIETKLDTTRLKREISDLNKELNKVRNEQAKVDAQADKAAATYAEEKEFDAQFPAEMSHREEIDERASKALDAIITKQEELNEKEKAYVNLLDEAKAKLTEMEAISDASKQVDKAMKTDSSLAKIKSQEDYNSLLDVTAAKMRAIEDAAEQVAVTTGLTKEQILEANPAYQKLSDTMGMLTTKADEFGNKAKSAGKKASSGLKPAKKEANGFGTAINKGIKKLGRMALAVFGIRGAYRAVSMAVTEYLSTNEELAAQVEAIKSGFAQVLGPAIEWVVNLLLKAISAVNAFVTALTGINFVAKANEAALKKQAKAASQGNSTAGFDEQTKLSDSGTGSSGGATATLPDGSNIDLSFLDPLMEAIKKFKDDIAPLIKTVGDLFKWLWQEVLVPLGDWALNGVLPGFLNILGGAFLVLNDALVTLQPIAKWIWDNVLQPIAEWTGGVIVDVLNAIGDWIHKHHETLGKVLAVVGAIAAVLVGVPVIISAITTVLGFIFNPITLIVAAVAGLIALFVTMYDECEGFRAGMDQVWQGIKDIFFAGVDFVRALFQGDWAGMDAAWARIKEAGVSLWQGLVEGLKAGWDWCAEKVAAIWNNVVEWFKDIFGIHSPSTVFAEFGGYMMEGLVNGIKNAISKVTNACQQILSAIKGVFSSVGSWFKTTFTNAWTAVKNVFSSGGKIFSGIKDGIASTFKTIVNGLITGINKVIAVPFNSINGMLNTIRGITILGVSPFKSLWSYNPLSVPQIPKLALGGIVNRPGRGVPAIIGEAGKEAVLPLENHTEWMDILADKIGGGTVTIPIYLDGKKIYTYMVDIGKRKAFAANGG